MSAISPAERLKKVMRIALVGIRPADQVMLKGYFRLLLRLEADLEWVSANNPQIDLFLVNQEFEHADSVQRLLASMPTSATLFVNRKDDGDGQMFGNILTLPLKELEPLNIWLFKNVAFLQGSHTPNVSANPQKSNTNNVSKNRQTLDEIIANRTNQSPNLTENSPSGSSHVMTTQPSLMGIVNFINQLQKQEDQLLTLTDNHGNILAYIQPKRQLIWTVHTNINLTPQWQLKPTASTPKIIENPSLDLVQWLWNIAWENPNLLNALIQPTVQYRLAHWVKPESHQNRHDMLKIQCVLEVKDVTLDELINLTQITPDNVIRCLTGLLMSGVLSSSVYQHLANYTPMNQPISQNIAIKTQPTTAQPISPQVTRPTTHTPTLNMTNQSSIANKSTETHNEGGMMGFLSKLRRKLGL